MRPAPVLAASLAVLASAAAISIVVALADTPMRGETRIVREVQSWPFPGDTLSDAIRALTTTWLVTVLGCALAAGTAATGARRDALALLAMLFVLAWLQPALKEIVDRPRPTEDFFDIRGSITSASFPAGHVMSPTVLYGYIIALCATTPWPRPLRMTAATLSALLLVLTGIVNIWLGVHWPTDVIGGYLWGASIVLAVTWAVREIEQALRSRRT
jgi:undecaprenyl-diphosphatase